MLSKASIPELGKLLQEWYKQNFRPLPWRENKDPYRIWVSEVMLQQTTVTAVIPYYQRFLTALPTVQHLANAKIEKIYELWSGLGYYSRARNLHKSAQSLAKINFPRTAEELIELPGFGPYTSRAVASLAFNQPVGVLDGNVIRVLSRAFGIKAQWWKSSQKEMLQKISDELAKSAEPSQINQGMMELGATICTPQSPTCFLCPWNQHCVAFKKGWIESLPLKKPRKKNQVWIWQPIVMFKNKKVALIQNNYAPFLKGHLIFPGTLRTSPLKPKTYDLRHGITHHDIYIQIRKGLKSNVSKDVKWISVQKMAQHNPSSLIKKVLGEFSS